MSHHTFPPLLDAATLPNPDSINQEDHRTHYMLASASCG
jgi:hypothetical protein